MFYFFQPCTWMEFMKLSFVIFTRLYARYGYFIIYFKVVPHVLFSFLNEKSIITKHLLGEDHSFCTIIEELNNKNRSPVLFSVVFFWPINFSLTSSIIFSLSLYGISSYFYLFSAEVF